MRAKKQFAGITALLAAGVVLRFGPLLRGWGLDIRFHDTYRVVSASHVAFWLLIGIALAWLLIVASRKFIKGSD